MLSLELLLDGRVQPIFQPTYTEHPQCFCHLFINLSLSVFFAYFKREAYFEFWMLVIFAAKMSIGMISEMTEAASSEATHPCGWSSWGSHYALYTRSIVSFPQIEASVSCSLIGEVLGIHTVSLSAHKWMTNKKQKTNTETQDDWDPNLKQRKWDTDALYPQHRAVKLGLHRASVHGYAKQ